MGTHLMKRTLIGIQLKGETRAGIVASVVNTKTGIENDDRRCIESNVVAHVSIGVDAMNLGTLEYKDEDCQGSAFFDARDAVPWITIERANRLLRERLGKAPEVSRNHHRGSGWGRVWETGHVPNTTHKARLVAIEEVGK